MTALGDMGEELAQTLAAVDLLWVGDLATKDGLRIRSYQELQWAGVTPTGMNTKKWYEVIRHALCKDGDETAILLEKFITPPMAPDVKEFGLCWWTQQQQEENQTLRANDGSTRLTTPRTHRERDAVVARSGVPVPGRDEVYGSYKGVS